MAAHKNGRFPQLPKIIFRDKNAILGASYNLFLQKKGTA